MNETGETEARVDLAKLHGLLFQGIELFPAGEGLEETLLILPRYNLPRYSTTVHSIIVARRADRVNSRYSGVKTRTLRRYCPGRPWDAAAPHRGAGPP